MPFRGKARAVNIRAVAMTLISVVNMVLQLGSPARGEAHRRWDCMWSRLAVSWWRTRSGLASHGRRTAQRARTCCATCNPAGSDLLNGLGSDELWAELAEPPDAK